MRYWPIPGGLEGTACQHPLEMPQDFPDFGNARHELGRNTNSGVEENFGKWHLSAEQIAAIEDTLARTMNKREIIDWARQHLRNQARR
jgi:hypothetical protein